MIARKIQDVEVIDVGKANGMPAGLITVQWIVSNKVGDSSYHHDFAVRKYTLQPMKPEQMPFHNHKYVQCMTLIKGRLWVENPKESFEVGPGDSVYFSENEPHKAVPIGEETVELYCIIDCPDEKENCWPEAIVKIADCGTN